MENGATHELLRLLQRLADGGDRLLLLICAPQGTPRPPASRHLSPKGAGRQRGGRTSTGVGYEGNFSACCLGEQRELLLVVLKHL